MVTLKLAETSPINMSVTMVVCLFGRGVLELQGWHQKR
jgi:hypothetical protein